MIAHFLNNGIIIVLEACGLNTELTVFDWAPLWAAVLVTVLSAASLIVAAWFIIFDKTPLKKPVKGGVKNFFLAAGVGIVVLVIIWIAGLFA